MIDFDRLVLGPCQAVFGKPIIVTPLVSQPGVAPYSTKPDGVSPLTGIWSVKPIDVQMEDGSIMSSQTNRLGIRLSDFAVPIAPGDKLAVDGVTYLVDDTDDDGQGATDLTLKQVLA